MSTNQLSVSFVDGNEDEHINLGNPPPPPGRGREHRNFQLESLRPNPPRHSPPNHSPLRPNPPRHSPPNHSPPRHSPPRHNPPRQLVPISQRAPILIPNFVPVIHNQIDSPRISHNTSNINPIPRDVVDRTRRQRPSGIIRRHSPDDVRLSPIQRPRNLQHHRRHSSSRPSSGPETN